MNCPKCGKKLLSDMKTCPNCESKNIKDNNIELPKLKDKENYPKKEVKNSEIKKIIKESKNNDSLKEKKKNITQDKNNEKIDISKKDNDLKTTDKNKEIKNEEKKISAKESVKKHNKPLFFACLISLIISIIVLISIIYGSFNNNLKGNYLILLDNALLTYHDDYNYEEILDILTSIKKDSNKIKNAQTKINEYGVKWIEEYLSQDIKTLGDFEEVSSKYKRLITDLHAKVIISDGNLNIKGLKDNDYDNLLKKLDKIYNDSSIYYQGIEYYNQNDYNKSYETFNKIEGSNTYYEKSQLFKNKILEDIIFLLEKDIEKIESTVKDLNEQEKLDVYIKIDKVLKDYLNVYNLVNLKEYTSYNIIVEEYQNKIASYN